VSIDAAARPLYVWYGDDFTGSTDVLEALALHGVKAVLFTHTPSSREIAVFSDCRAVGIAGESRSRSPHWMSRNLPAIFRAMRRLGAPIDHYKVCSTFDSSPRTGSIGRAIELGRTVFCSGTVPIVVGAPHLGRAVVFGNLFAETDGAWYRIDRHPTMRQHPVTPMTEPDLRLHLAQQTKLTTGLVDLTAFQSHTAQKHWQAKVNARAGAVVLRPFGRRGEPAASTGRSQEPTRSAGRADVVGAAVDDAINRDAGTAQRPFPTARRVVIAASAARRRRRSRGSPARRRCKRK